MVLQSSFNTIAGNVFVMLVSIGFIVVCCVLLHYIKKFLRTNQN